MKSLQTTAGVLIVSAIIFPQVAVPLVLAGFLAMVLSWFEKPAPRTPQTIRRMPTGYEQRKRDWAWGIGFFWFIPFIWLQRR